MSGKRAVAYIRVSTKPGAGGLSMEAQEQAIRARAAEGDYELVDIYRDHAPARSRKRPGLNQMLNDAEAGKFDAIIVMSVARLFRNKQFERWFNLWLRERGGIELLAASWETWEEMWEGEPL